MRTEYEDKGPCAVAHEEKENGGTAPAITDRDDELEKSEEKKDCLERNKGDADRR